MIFAIQMKSSARNSNSVDVLTVEVLSDTWQFYENIDSILPKNLLGPNTRSLKNSRRAKCA